jgi:ferritin
MTDLHTDLAEVNVAIDQAHTQLLIKMISIAKSESYDAATLQDLDDLIKDCNRHASTFNYLARQAALIQQTRHSVKLIKRELNTICEDLTSHLPELLQPDADKK